MMIEHVAKSPAGAVGRCLYPATRLFADDPALASRRIDLRKTVVVCPRQAEEERLGRINSMRASREALFPRDAQVNGLRAKTPLN
jgi:hypothetical protein